MSKAKVETIQQPEIKLDFYKAICERREKAIREQNAKEYIEYCKRKRIAKAKRKQDRKDKIVVLVLFLILIATIVVKYGNISKASDDVNNEPHYEMTNEGHITPTEKVCEVVKVEDNIVTVEYANQLYSFYGDGFLKGEKVVCKFINGVEIVDVKR